MFNRIAVKQLIANLMLWLCVVIVIGVFHQIRGNDYSSPFPTDELVKLINISLLMYLFIAGGIVFTMFSFIRHRSSNREEELRSTEFASLSLDEIGSAFYNFGSLLIAAVAAGADSIYIVGALVSYLFGLYLKWPNG
ncbi:hypothetical protein V9N60_003577 [Vibrio metoecus]